MSTLTESECLDAIEEFLSDTNNYRWLVMDNTGVGIRCSMTPRGRDPLYFASLVGRSREEALLELLDLAREDHEGAL